MKPTLEKNKHYKLKVNLYGRIEEYTGLVLDTNKESIRLETDDDIACNALRLNHKDIFYAKEVECKKVQKIHKISNKKKFENLKESIHPEF